MTPRAHQALAFLAEWIVPILLVLLVPLLALGYVLDHNGKVRTYKAQVAACERGNILRIRINTKFDVYDTAFDEIAKALKDSKTTVGKRLYEVTRAAVVTAPDALPLVNCTAVYDRPRWFWQGDSGAEESHTPLGPVGPVGATEGGKG